MLSKLVPAVLIVSLVAAPLTLRGQAAHAKSPQLEKAAQVSFEEVINGIQVHKKLMEDLKKRFEPSNKALAKRNAEIESLRKQLDQGTNLSGKERENLEATIAAKTNALLLVEKQARDDFHKAYIPVRQKIDSKVMDVLTKYANANGYAVVLETGSPVTRVTWASAAIANRHGLEETPWPELETKLLAIFSVKEAQPITQELIVACNAEIRSLD